MTPRDVEHLRWQLITASGAATRLAGHLEDLHAQAFLAQVGDFEHVNGGAEHPGVETVGDLRARNLWDRLCATATDLDTLLPLERKIMDYFMAGPSADGSSHPLVSKGDWRQSFKYRDRRAAAGEYTPVPLEQQPPYGGAR